MNPCPKPAPKEKKLPKPLRRTRVVTRRKKARKGRLKDEELGRLRELCFERDVGMCVVCGVGLLLKRGYWNSMEMAHIRGKRMWGDSLDNVRSLCGPLANGCHHREHVYGKTLEKPCKAKERAQ